MKYVEVQQAADQADANARDESYLGWRHNWAHSTKVFSPGPRRTKPLP
jgi:hypothetical protein